MRENNQDKQDKTPDLYLYYNDTLLVPFEVKSITTPFRSAKKLVGIPPERCVSLQVVELKSVYEYAAGKGLIGFHLDFRPEFNFTGEYFGTVNSIYKLYKQSIGTNKIRMLSRSDSKKREVLYFHLHNLKPLAELLEISERFHDVSDRLLNLIGLTEVA